MAVLDALLASPEAMAASDEGLRRAGLEELLRRLGRGFSRAGDGALAVVHDETGLAFVAVAGGDFDMGLTETDIEALADHVDYTAPLAARVEAIAASARPVHRVALRPFLCAVRLLDRAELDPFGAEVSVSRDEALAVAQALGFRLLSEAELEWLARDGARTSFTLDAAEAGIGSDDRRLVSRFGLRQLHEATWAADAWHPDYQGAPRDGRAWLGGDDRGVQRGGFWLMAMQGEEELLAALAALRHRGASPARIRLARDLGDLAAHPRPEAEVG